MEQLDVLAKQVNRNPSVVIGAIMIVTAIMFTILITAPEAGDPSQSGFIPENDVVDAIIPILDITITINNINAVKIFVNLFKPNIDVHPVSAFHLSILYLQFISKF